MTKIEKKLLLEEKVSIRLIQKPYCKTCMNKIDESKDLCSQCEAEHPLKDEEWCFNKIVALGYYKTHDNAGYNKIPHNILSKIILILKSNVARPKSATGKLIAQGLYHIIKNNPFLIDNDSYIVIPPKFSDSVENQCIHFLKPLIYILKKNRINIQNISNKLIKKKDTGKNKGKSRMERFNEIKGAHEMELDDLNERKILILDDVITTTSTIWDISRALKEKNAGEINIFAIGRAQDLSTFPSDLDFNELITFFSNLDTYLYPEKIDEVSIENFSLDDKHISCTCGDYEISLDLVDCILKHNCFDFEKKRLRYKGFCKHLTKLFLFIKENISEAKARNILNSIYENILFWEWKLI